MKPLMIVRCLLVFIICFVSLFNEQTVIAQGTGAHVGQAAQVLQLWRELQYADGWECDLFKSNQWVRIANALSERAKTGLTIDQITTDHFAALRTSPIVKNEYDVYRKALENAVLAAQSTRERQEPLKIELKDETVEFMWTLQHLAPMVEACLRDKGDRWLRQADANAVRSVVEEAIRRYAENHRRLAKLRVLLAQTPEIKQLLGINATKYQAWLNGWLGPDLAGAHNLTMDQIRQTQRTAGELVELETQIRAEMKRLKAWFTERIPQYEMVLDTMERTARQLTIDYPPDAAPGAPRLRFKINWPDERLAAAGWPSADIILVLPRTNSSEYEVNLQKTASFGGYNSKGSAAAADEFPLGIRGAGVRLEPNGVLQFVPQPINTIGIVDRSALEESLRRLGLPVETAIREIHIDAKRNISKARSLEVCGKPAMRVIFVR
jgi:hypothetical protein